MIIGRSAEIRQLCNYYDRDKSQILVLYGQEYIGKTALLKEFIADKPNFYYNAKPCSEREQKYRFGIWLASLGIKTLKYPEFSDVFACFGRKHTQKKVIVIDEFQNIIKQCPEFMNELVSFIHNSWNNQEYLVILVSSSIEFIENSMVSRIGEAAYELSGFLKLKEMSFKDCKEFFSLYSNEECAEVFSILGGVPGLWMMFDEKQSVKDNIVHKIISRDGVLHRIGEQIVEKELRETGVYNTILASIADGKQKLNELHAQTEFSRAKISVYLKNLIELELVEKVFSLETNGKENVQKGLYRICNHFVAFYYTFLYRNASALEIRSPEEFYIVYVVTNLKSYIGRYFPDICNEYLIRQNDAGRLPVHFTKSGTWVGKQGTIDFVAQDEDGKTILAICNYDKPMMTYDDYEWLLFCAEKAKVGTDYIYLFTGSGFDEKLNLEAKVRKNLKLVLVDNI